MKCRVLLEFIHADMNWSSRPAAVRMKKELRQHLLFARLDPPVLERVERRARRIKLDGGEALFEQGDAAQRFYMVCSGQIKLFRLSPSGDEKVVEIITPGHTFAEALMFHEHPSYPVGAQALEKSEVISIDAVDFHSMLKGSTETCLLLLGDMSQRLRGLLQEIDELSLQSATCRVAAYLANQMPEDNNIFELSLPKNVLASRLSVKPETFSRIIRNLSDHSILSVSGSHIEIINREGLQKIADSCVHPAESTFISPCLPEVRN